MNCFRPPPPSHTHMHTFPNTHTHPQHQLFINQSMQNETAIQHLPWLSAPPPPPIPAPRCSGLLKQPYLLRLIISSPIHPHLFYFWHISAFFYLILPPFFSSPSYYPTQSPSISLLPPSICSTILHRFFCLLFIYFFKLSFTCYYYHSTICYSL